MQENDGTARSIKRQFTEEAIVSFLQYLIITHFSSEEFGGYDIIRYIEKEFYCLLSPGTVYTTLYAMERKELIRALRTVSRKKTFKVSEKGKIILEVLSQNNFAASLTNRFFRKCR